MRVVGFDGQQRAAKKALAPKPPRAPVRPRGGVDAGGRSQYVVPATAVHHSPSRQQKLPNYQQRTIYPATRQYLRQPKYKPPGHKAGFIDHVLGGVGQGVKALGQQVFVNPVEYSKDIAEGKQAKAQRTQHQIETFSKGFAKGLAPQSLVDIAHGHAPSGEHLGSDALFFLPWSRALRASAEAVRAAHVAEEGAKAADAAEAAKSSYKAGKGVGDATAQGLKRLRPSERALRASPARKELFAHLDETLDPRIAKAQKQLFDKSVKAMVRNGTAKDTEEAVGRLIHVRTPTDENIANHHNLLMQADGRPSTPEEIRQRLHRHLDRNLPPEQAAAHKRIYDEAVKNTPPEDVGKIAAIHAHLADEAKAGGLTHPGDMLHQDFVEPPRSAGEVAMQAATDRGTVFKGGFEHTSQGGIIHLTPHADVTTFPHELGHFLRRYGLNPEHEARIAEWAGAKNGVWDTAAEEKFATGLEKMIRQGDAPNNLVEEFKRLEPEFRKAYPNAGQLPAVPANVAQVYKEILGHRDGPQALYYALHNALVGRQLAAEARQGAPRTPEEAQAHVLEANRLAEEEGHGRYFPPTIEHKEGEFSPETGGVAGHEVRVGMRGVSKLRNEQETVREAQRYRKAGNLRGAQQAALDAEHPSEALTEAGGARAGLLEHSDFKGFENLRSYLDDLATHVINFEHMRPYDKQNAWDAIINGIDGQVPRKFEQKLLEKLFGKEQESITQQLKNGTFGEKIANVFNVPRALMASGDLSAPFRQGLMLLAHDPRLFFANYGPMFKDTFSEARFQQTMSDIREMPTHALSEKAGVAYTQAGAKISQREEQYASDMAEHLHELPGVRSTPGLKHVAKGASAVVRGSDRGYVAFLDKSRADLFDMLVHQAAEQGYHLDGPHGEKLVKDIAKYVNSATGRGDLGKFADHAATLNTLFFSPRLLKSRLDFLNPVWYMRMEPFARRQALRSAVRLAATLGTVLMFARAAGATVVDDPRNADFGKIRIGDTRLDIAGGFTQPLRLVAQLASGQIVSSQTGRLENLSGTGFGSSRLDVTSQFLENKFAPVPGTIVDLLRGSQFGGQPISASSEVYQHMVPLLWQDMAQIYHSAGPKGLAAYGPEDLFGVGVQNYGAPGPKTKQDTNKLLSDSQKYLGRKPPAQVESDVQWKAKLDANTYAGQSEFDRATAAVKLFDQRYGTHLETSVLPHLHTQGQAQALYEEIRARLFPSLEAWQSALDRAKIAAGKQTPVPQNQNKQGAGRPPVVNTGQESSYHIPPVAGKEAAGGQQTDATANYGVDAAQHTIVHGQHASYIAQAAQQHGLDPQAVLAVASQEGLSGGVGDGGTSFGPFQLHEGGALPSEVAARGAQYAQKWAWSPAGINYALSRMASVAHGLHGQAAVNAIVSRFERPANVAGEEAGAMRAYGGPVSEGPIQFAGGGGPEGRVANVSPNLSNAAEVALQGLASGTYSPMKVLTVLSSQPLQNTVEMPGFGHIRFQIPKLSGPVGRAARGAIALAQAYLGTPYVWGGESPRGFDCSGLVQYIYGKQGVSIPRTSQEQWKTGQRVAKSQLRPGDVVFFVGSDGTRNAPGHEGIYIGHGKFIEAPHTGATVRISNLAGYPGYVGARRYARGRK